MRPETNTTSIPPELARYSRQILFENIGVEGQRKLAQSRVVLFGCGALGTVLANTLVRAGVGFLRICDRDFIDLDNLQRQVLFDEADIAKGIPKAEAAARKLRVINSAVTVEPHVLDVNHTNIERLAADADLLLDGTDNFETRFLINDLAVSTRRPWIYGAVIGSTGLCMPILPHETPCLRCVFEEAPPAEMNPTCDTAGVLSSVVNIVASLQAVEAMKILMGHRNELNRSLVNIDVWTGHFANLNVQSTYDNGNCPCCKRGDFPFLSGRMAGSTTTLCGRDAVQINTVAGRSIDLAAIAAKIRPIAEGPVITNRFLLKTKLDNLELTLFPDGRAIIRGTKDSDRARTLYAKYVGT